MFNKFILISSLIFSILCAYDGIDVSEHQGNIDFNKVKQSGKNFVIIRGGYGYTYIDPYFEQNYKNAKAAGLNVGFYWYSYGTSEDSGISEANKALSVLKGKKFEYPIYYDVEEARSHNLGVTRVSNMINNFCSIMESNGFFCGIYASKSHFDTYFNNYVKTRFTVWVAQYYDRFTYGGDYKILQYSSTGRVGGINGNVDLDVSYEDFPSIMKDVHLNGY